LIYDVFLEKKTNCVIVGGEVCDVEVVEHNEPKSRVKGQRAMRKVVWLFSPPHKQNVFVFLSHCKFPLSLYQSLLLQINWKLWVNEESETGQNW